MERLIKFFERHGSLILFIILESLCIIMLINSQPFHSRKVAKVYNNIAGTYIELNNTIRGYFSLREENRQLIEQNTALLQENYRLKENIHVGNSLPLDSSRYTVFDATIIRSETYKENNFLIINRGLEDGVERDMGVVSADGVVGTIAEVGRHYSSVVSLLNSNTLISVRIKKNGQLATVRWETGNYRYGQLVDVPTFLKMQEGDTIVTSGLSSSFPADMMVGTIAKIYDSPSNDFNSAKILLATDFSKLRNVFILVDKDKTQIDSLLIKSQNDGK